MYVLYVICFSSSALLRRATVYYHMDNFQMAAEDLQMVLREEPHNATATVGEKAFWCTFIATSGDCIWIGIGLYI